MTVSILIATYGESHWQKLAERRALPSASNQGAAEVIVRHSPDLNLAEARNEAAMKATSEWLCFLDADDELAPGYIAAMEEAMAEARPWSLLVPRVQYVTVLREVEIAEGETGLYTKSKPPEFPNRQHPMTVMNHCVIGTLVPRELFLAVGGFRGDLVCYEDWSMFLCCVRAGAGLVDVEDAVYRAYVRPEGRNESGSREARQQAYDQIRRAFNEEAA